MEGNYSIKIEDFAERHFVKTFQKKYKNAWDTTLVAIKAELERLDSLLLTDKADLILIQGNIRIIKTDFRVAGTKESAKSSGNRCIVAQHLDTRIVRVLLVYCKTDLSGKNETAEWKQLVKNNYPDFKSLF